MKLKRGDTRYGSNLLLTAIEAGLVKEHEVLLATLNYMSESDVENLVDSDFDFLHELLEENEDEDDE